MIRSYRARQYGGDKVSQIPKLHKTLARERLSHKVSDSMTPRVVQQESAIQVTYDWAHEAWGAHLPA